jgi:hypothetical protein
MVPSISSTDNIPSKIHNRIINSPPTHLQSSLVIVFDRLARLEGGIHLRHGEIAMAATGGCHCALC